MANLRIPVGLMPGHPHQFGHRQGPIAWVPHVGVEGLDTIDFSQLSRLFFGPAVRVQDRRPDRLPLRIQGDQVLHLSAHDDAGDLVALEVLKNLPSFSQKVTGHLDEGLQPILGILLDTSVSCVNGQKTAGRAHPGSALLIHKNGLDLRSAHVECGCIGHTGHPRPSQPPR